MRVKQPFFPVVQTSEMLAESDASLFEVHKALVCEESREPRDERKEFWTWEKQENSGNKIHKPGEKGLHRRRE